MGQLAVCAVFYPILCHPEIPAALISQCIQRAVTEQTVKVLGISPLVTRKIFTFFITEESVMLPFPIWFFHLFHLICWLFLFFYDIILCRKRFCTIWLFSLEWVTRFFFYIHDIIKIHSSKSTTSFPQLSVTIFSFFIMPLSYYIICFLYYFSLFHSPFILLIANYHLFHYKAIKKHRKILSKFDTNSFIYKKIQSRPCRTGRLRIVFRGFAILLRGRQWIRSNMRRERMHPE